MTVLVPDSQTQVSFPSERGVGGAGESFARFCLSAQSRKYDACVQDKGGCQICGRGFSRRSCLSVQEIRPDGDLVLDVVIFLWNKVKEVMQGDELQNPSFTYCIEKIDNFDKVCLVIAQTDHFIVNYLCIV